MKKYWRRAIIAGAAICLAGSLMTGCGKKSEDSHGLSPSSPVEIEVWTYYNGESQVAFEKMVKEFNKTEGKEKGVQVKSSSTGGVNELIEKLRNELKKEEDQRELPDIFSCYMDTAREIDQEGLLVDLSQYFSEEELSQYVESYINEGRIGEDGSLKVLPVAKSTEVLFLNKTDWEKFAGETGKDTKSLETWEGLVETAADYYKWSKGKAFFGRDSMANYILVGSTQLGQEPFQLKEGKLDLNLDKETMRRLWDNYYVPYINGYFTANGRFRSDDMKTGDIIAMAASSSGASFVPTEVTVDSQEPYPIETEILPLPNFEGTQPCAIQQGAGMAVSKSSEKSQYGASLFLKWFTQEERNSLFSVQTSYMPVRKGAYETGFIEKVLEKNKVEWDTANREAILTAIEQCSEYNLYSGQTFAYSTEARNVLEDSMASRAKEDREKVMEMVKGGISQEEAVAQFNNDSHYEEWYQGLLGQLYEVCHIEE